MVGRAGADPNDLCNSAQGEVFEAIRLHSRHAGGDECFTQIAVVVAALGCCDGE